MHSATNQFIKKVLYILSPCVLAALFCVFAIATGYLQMESSGGWSYLAVIIFLPVLISAVIIDIAARLLLKKAMAFLANRVGNAGIGLHGFYPQVWINFHIAGRD